MPTLSNRVQSADVFEPGSSQHKAILYVGCPPIEREAAEKRFASSKLTVVWIDSLPQAVDELRRRERPVVVDLSRAGTLQFVRDLRAQRPASVMFAIVDSGRPDLATEAVLAGLNEVFVRPIGGRRIINAINRELESAEPGSADSSDQSDELYCQSAAMRSVNASSPQPRSSMVSSGFGARRSRTSAPRSKTKRALRAYPGCVPCLRPAAELAISRET